jgi:hypothetical protein
VVQTCIVACSSVAFTGGFGCYLLSMDRQTYENLGDIAGNRAQACAPPAPHSHAPHDSPASCSFHASVSLPLLLSSHFM